jgi:multicomponent Na+:H+ antiporter subunit F
MIASSGFLHGATMVALALLSVSFLLTVIKVIKGPTLPDRILALDMLVAVAIGFIAVIGIKTGFTLYVDIAIALGLVGFLATVAFARFILARGRSERVNEIAESAPDAEPVAFDPITAKEK